MKERRWQDVAMLVLGVWLILAPFILRYGDYTGMIAVTSYVFGVAVAIFAISALIKPQMWEEWVNLGLGALLFIAPFVLGFSNASVPTANHLIVGLLIAGDAAWVMSLPSMRKTT